VLKICPLPVKIFTGRKEILDKISQYFYSSHKAQHVFVLHGLGGSGKSQLAFKFLEDSQANQWYGFIKYAMDIIYSLMFYRFSDIFYIDATNQQTLEADLVAITPTNVEQSVDACKHWLATKHKQNWLLFFDNADDVQLNLAAFFPKCRFGNILITTRNPQLSIYADQGADAKVADMDPEDAKYLLMQISRAKNTDESEKLAASIVKVPFIIISYDICLQANYWKT